MQALEETSQFELAVKHTTAELLKMPQADCPVVHRFGPGIYIRELTVEAGAFVIGFRQKTEHVNIMLAGKVTMLNPDGTKTLIEAPYFAVMPPGRKVGYVHEEMVWQNIYATEETDIEKLEAMYLDKDEAFDEYVQDEVKSAFDRTVDREDFLRVIDELGFTPEEVRRQAEEAEAIPLPFGSYKIKIAPSLIEGKGVFATADIEAGESIAPARIGYVRTVVGRYTNHAKEPNAEMVFYADGTMMLQATKNLTGMKGGLLGDEITVDYYNTYKLNEALSCPEQSQPQS